MESTKPTIVFHCAAAIDGRYWSGDWSQLERSIGVNIRGTVNLLEAIATWAPQVTRIVRTGTIEEYGTGDAHSEEQRERPISLYSATQVAATHLSETLSALTRLPIVTLRPALIYGPAQSLTFFVPSLIRSCLEGQPFDMTSGEQRRDFVFVRDVVDACIRAATAPNIVGRRINIMSGVGHRILDVAALILRLTGRSSELLRVGRVTSRRLDADCLIGIPTLASELLGWHATWSLEAGLAATIEWYDAHGNENR